MILIIPEETMRKLDRCADDRLARECAKLDPAEEKAFAEEGLSLVAALDALQPLDDELPEVPDLPVDD